jgi:hypothetical protein
MVPLSRDTLMGNSAAALLHMLRRRPNPALHVMLSFLCNCVIIAAPFLETPYLGDDPLTVDHHISANWPVNLQVSHSFLPRGTASSHSIEEN